MKTLKMSVEFAYTPWEKFMGLMFRKDFKGVLVFVLNRKTRIGASIHTMFMRFPIDVLFLDEKRRVIDIARDVKPWRLNITPKKPCSFILEMKAGKAQGIKIGDRIRLSPPNA